MPSALKLRPGQALIEAPPPGHVPVADFEVLLLLSEIGQMLCREGTFCALERSTRVSIRCTDPQGLLGQILSLTF